MSLSSSSDEDTEKLLEALDPSLLTDRVLKASTGNDDAKMKKSPKLRASSAKKMDDFDDEGFSISVGCRNYIAQKLNKLLEDNIKVCSEKHDLVKTTTNVNSGIKLLKSSSVPITLEEELPLPKNRSKKRPVDSSSDDDETQKLAEAAVTGDWVLEKQGVFEFPDCRDTESVLNIKDSEKMFSSDGCSYKKKKKVKHHESSDSISLSHSLENSVPDLCDYQKNKKKEKQLKHEAAGSMINFSNTSEITSVGRACRKKKKKEKRQECSDNNLMSNSLQNSLTVHSACRKKKKKEKQHKHHDSGTLNSVSHSSNKLSVGSACRKKKKKEKVRESDEKFPINNLS